MEGLAAAAAAAEPIFLVEDDEIDPADAARERLESDNEEGPAEIDDEEDARPPGDAAPEAAEQQEDIHKTELTLTLAPPPLEGGGCL